VSLLETRLASNGASKLNVSSSIVSTRREEETEAEGDWTVQDGCQGGCNAAGALLSIISCPPTARSRGGLLQTSDGSILGRDDDESKAASGGRRKNGKHEVEMVWVCQWSRFKRLRTGITWLPVLTVERRAGRRQKTAARGVRFCRPSHS
jgi:hypothetical protein